MNYAYMQANVVFEPDALSAVFVAEIPAVSVQTPPIFVPLIVVIAQHYPDTVHAALVEQFDIFKNKI